MDENYEKSSIFAIVAMVVVVVVQGWILGKENGYKILDCATSPKPSQEATTKKKLNPKL